MDETKKMSHQPSAQIQLERIAQLLSQQRYAEVIAQSEDVLAQDMQCVEAHQYRALALLQSEKIQAAQEAITTALKIDPMWPFAHIILGWCYQALKQPNEALSCFEQAQAIDPMWPKPHIAKASLYLSVDQYQQAKIAIDQALALDPVNKEALPIHSAILLALGDRQGSASSAEQALRQAPQNARAHTMMGWSELHANNIKTAQDHFLQALRSHPASEQAKAGLVECLKARNVVYRVILSGLLWLSRLDRRAQIGLAIGAYILFRVVRTMTASNPEYAYIGDIALAVYLGLVYITWLAVPCGDLCLLTSRMGRAALHPLQRRAAMGLGIGFILLGGICFMWLGRDSVIFSMVDLLVGLMMVALGVNRLAEKVGDTRRWCNALIYIAWINFVSFLGIALVIECLYLSTEFKVLYSVMKINFVVAALCGIATMWLKSLGIAKPKYRVK